MRCSINLPVFWLIMVRRELSSVFRPLHDITTCAWTSRVFPMWFLSPVLWSYWASDVSFSLCIRYILPFTGANKLLYAVPVHSTETAHRFLRRCEEHHKDEKIQLCALLASADRACPKWRTWCDLQLCRLLPEKIICRLTKQKGVHKRSVALLFQDMGRSWKLELSQIKQVYVTGQL